MIFQAVAQAFRRSMQRRAETIQRRGAARVVRNVRLAYTHLTDATPVLTGKARAEWQIAIDSDPSGEVAPSVRYPEHVDYETYAAAALSTLDEYRSGQHIYVVNNAPYISDLNAGKSPKAPAGFIEAALEQARAEAGALND